MCPHVHSGRASIAARDEQAGRQRRPWRLGLRVAALAVAAALAAPAQAMDTVDVAYLAPAAQDGLLDHLARRINDYRREQGLSPLAWSDELAALAGEHSQGMAGQRQLSHAGFRTRMGRAGSRMCVENVAHNFPTAETLLDGWRRSPGHHRNLLEPKVARMGLAATARYVTFFACR